MSQCSVAATDSEGGRARYWSENLMRSWLTVGIRRATPSPVRWDGMSSFQLLTCRAIPCASMARPAMVLHRPHASCSSGARLATDRSVTSIALGSLTPHAAGFLAAAGLNIVVAGSTQAGKATSREPTPWICA